MEISGVRRDSSVSLYLLLSRRVGGFVPCGQVSSSDISQGLARNPLQKRLDNPIWDSYKRKCKFGLTVFGQRHLKTIKAVRPGFSSLFILPRR